jgi:pyruvate,orthophosphate dikinase
MPEIDQLEKSVYLFGGDATEGHKDMKSLLGGKGANLAEMATIGLPVPPGFTITTEICNLYHKLGKDTIVSRINNEVRDGIKHIEQIMDTGFDTDENPCLVSVRSGARASMPGMMDTVLNIGLNDRSVEGIAKKTGNERFAWDSYRRLIQMYSDVVLRVSDKTENGENPYEEALEHMKDAKAVATDQDLSLEDLKELVEQYKEITLKYAKTPFPQDPWEQLWNTIMAVFQSWFTPRAVFYRQLNEIPNDWGTAVNVQAMVFGNMGSESASGVAFTRDAGSGDPEFNGEYLTDAQGEDVVAGIRTPLQITKSGSLRWAKLAGISESNRLANYPSLEESKPEVYASLFKAQEMLENHYRDMQDMEFTIQEGKLFILQTRDGKRTGAAMVKIGIDLLDEKKITEEQLLLRMDPEKLNELLHPVFDQKALNNANPIVKGLPASPGASTGQVVFTSEEAVKLGESGKKVILVRTETSADDLKGMHASAGILTARGGMTSHAAVVCQRYG